MRTRRGATAYSSVCVYVCVCLCALVSVHGYVCTKMRTCARAHTVVWVDPLQVLRLILMRHGHGFTAILRCKICTSKLTLHLLRGLCVSMLLLSAAILRLQLIALATIVSSLPTSSVASRQGGSALVNTGGQRRDDSLLCVRIRGGGLASRARGLQRCGRVCRIRKSQRWSMSLSSSLKSRYPEYPSARALSLSLFCLSLSHAVPAQSSPLYVFTQGKADNYAPALVGSWQVRNVWVCVCV